MNSDIKEVVKEVNHRLKEFYPQFIFQPNRKMGIFFSDGFLAMNFPKESLKFNNKSMGVKIQDWYSEIIDKMYKDDKFLLKEIKKAPSENMELEYFWFYFCEIIKCSYGYNRQELENQLNDTNLHVYEINMEEMFQREIRIRKWDN